MPPELTEAPTADQGDIELANGITLSGMGGDVDALREQFEERHEERAATQPAKPTATAVAEKEPKGRERYGKLTRERDDSLAKLTAAETRVRELEAQIAAPPVAPIAEVPRVVPPAVEAQPTRPKPTEAGIGTKYAEYADFVEDLADWKAEQREAKLIADLEARSTQRIEADRASRTLADHVKDVIFPAGRAHYTDFDATIAASSKSVPYAVQAAVFKLAHPEHLIYALAKDETKIDGLAALMADPIALGIAVAQLMPRESVASPASTAPVVRSTNVPAPIQPVGAGTRTTKPTLQELAASGDYDAYKAARAAGQTE